MPCIPLREGNKQIGFVCVGNEPVSVGGGKYQVEWTEWGGWVFVNEDGSERLSPVPAWVWAEVEKLPRPGDKR